MGKPRPSTGPLGPDEGHQRGLRVELRLATVDDFVESFSRLVDETTIFFGTKRTFPIGLKRRFVIALRGGEVVFAGEGEVLESPAHLAGPTSPTGLRLRLLRLTRSSLSMHARLLERRGEREDTLVEPFPRAPQAQSGGDEPAPRPPPVRPPWLGPPIKVPDVIKPRSKTSTGLGPPAVVPTPRGKPKARRAPTVERARGADLVLPANPLSEIPDEGLHGLIDCLIFEDFDFPREGPENTDLVTPVPVLDGGGQKSAEPTEALSSSPVAAAEPRPQPEPESPPPSQPESPPPPVPEARPQPETELQPPAPPEPRPPPASFAPAAPDPAPAFSVEPQRVGAGRAGQLLIATLAVGVGFLGGYLVFGTELVISRDNGAPASAQAVASVDDADEAAEPLDAPGTASSDGKNEDEVLQQEHHEPDVAVPAALDEGDGAEEILPEAIAEDLDPGADEPGEDEAMDDELDPAPGVGDGCVARFRSVPRRARVFLDGDPIGLTPLTREVPCGVELAVAIDQNGFRRYQERVRAEPGQALEVTTRLSRLTTRLRVVSSPPGAIVTVGGKVVGKTPVNTVVPRAAPVHVSATLRNHKVFTRTVRPRGAQAVVRAELERIGN